MSLDSKAKQLQTLVDTAVDGVILIDARGVIRTFNPACERLFGYSADEAVGQNVKMLMPEPFRSGHDSYLRNYLRTGEKKIIGVGREVVGRRKDGSVFPMELSVGETSEGDDRQFVGIVHDITERKQAERDLQESERRFRLLVENVTDYGLFMLDTGGYVTNWNNGAQRIMQYEAADIIGRHFEIFYEPAQRADRAPGAALREALEKGKHESEGWRVRQDGTRFWASIVIDPVRDEDGTLIGFVNVARDVTAARAAQQAATESAEQLRVVVDTAVNGVILIDAKGDIRMFNPACERLFGYRAEDVLGRNVKMLMPAPYQNEHDGYLHNYMRTGERKIIGIGREVVGRRKDGSIFPMELSVGEARQLGEPMFVGVILDITERKRAEEQRELFIEQLTKSNEELGHFAFVASHDMRQHLRMVLAFSGLIKERSDDTLDDQSRKNLSIIIDAAQQMQDLVDDLLEFGRLDTEFERSTQFDANEQLTLALESLDQNIADSGALVESMELPTLTGNPVRFTRLMQNLIGNAIKYVAPNVRPRVQIAAADDGEFWRFSVADNGIGIAPDYHARIFEPFRRLHGRSEYGGTGLGLSICQKIVQGFGGTIWVDSMQGKGSTFYFTVRKSLEVAP